MVNGFIRLVKGQSMLPHVPSIGCTAVVPLNTAPPNTAAFSPVPRSAVLRGLTVVTSKVVLIFNEKVENVLLPFRHYFP